MESFQSAKEEVKRAADIVELIGQYVHFVGDPALASAPIPTVPKSTGLALFTLEPMCFFTRFDSRVDLVNGPCLKQLQILQFHLT